MTVTKKKKLQTINLAQVLANIKGGVKRTDQLLGELNHIRTRLFTNTYVWVEGMVAGGHLKSSHEAQSQLAKEIGRVYQCVQKWYACGKLMRKHSMTPDDVNANAVYVARHAEQSVGRPEYLAIVSAIKKGVHSGKIKSMLARGEAKNGKLIERRIRTLTADRLNNKLGGKMEMMVAYRIMCKAYGLDEGMLAFYDHKGKRIYKVGMDLED